MDVFLDANWQRYPAAVIGLLGVALFWRGLHGGPNGERGLLRRGVAMLDRLEGWRLTLLGLTLIGLGAAWFWEAYWLLFLSLGIGYVELQEASKIIQAWRWNGGQPRQQRSPPPT